MILMILTFYKYKQRFSRFFEKLENENENGFFWSSGKTEKNENENGFFFDFPEKLKKFKMEIVFFLIFWKNWKNLKWK